MLENVGRKVTLILVLLGVSLTLLLLDEPSLRLGLDLAGGQRLVYRFDFQQAEDQGLIPPGTNRGQLIEETIEIIRERVDPTGVTEPLIRKVGEDQIEINIPGTTKRSTARSTLAADVPGSGDGQLQPIQLAGSEEDLKKIPGGGGVIRIGDEKIRYSHRTGDQLTVDQRGYGGTAIAAHAAGDPVVLVSDDQIRAAIENLGDLKFMLQADTTDFTQRGTDEQSERQRLKDWWAKPENADAPISAFNALPRDQGGPVEGIHWYPYRLPDGAAFVPPRERRVDPFVVSPPEETFTGEDLKRVQPTTDELGYPAVHLMMESEAGIRLSEWTKDKVGRNLGMILEDEVISSPRIKHALGKSFIIEGQFTEDEVNNMVTVLRTGSLSIRPELIHQEQVGATLGADYVRRGLTSAALGLVTVLSFMILYYRGLGVFAAISLLCNMLLLFGAMTFLQATLTLPGIAGIILTVGMAVDANILIFDRIREESEKGRKPMQAALNGFKEAFSAIFDANVTTLLTAAILYKVGTGPVRGFAVTLGWGILTSLFAALVITRVLVHFRLERGTKGFPMMRWLADAKYDFIGKAKAALTLSTLMVIAGLVVFFITPDRDKLGLDFLGGASVKVRTEHPANVEDIRAAIARIPGGTGASASVTALPASATGDGLYTEFRITAKDTGNETEQGSETYLANEVREALADVIQEGPVEVRELTQADGAEHAVVDLYFEEQHTPEDVASALEAGGLLEPEVTRREGRDNVFEARFKTTFGLSEDSVVNMIAAAFDGVEDSAGALFALAEPVPETTVVGQQVVGDLRDSAIKALFISLFVVVMYIRVRFAEYSYGFAAMIAVLHDVLITLGVITAVGMEINLPLIAAFLTIVGYSLNDTIVVFDRVRENLPRVKGSLPEVVNLSINQTLSRTIMTSLTTLATVAILYAFNVGTESVLESFSFSLGVGIVVGTYSSIFIASPLFIWMETRTQKKLASQTARAPQKAAPAKA